MTTSRRSHFSADPVSFITRYIRRNELDQPFTLFPHQEEILRLAFQFDQEGRIPWDTIIYSCPKKSGKTSLNAMITCWWMFTQESPNELLILANDFEQAQARVFKTLAQLIQYNPRLAQSATIQARQIQLTNGSTVTALASEYAGSAGSNHGWSSWDELWAYDTEADYRLWEELCPVPTRRNSIRFVSTYAGFESESSLLRELYLQGVGPEEHREGKGERVHPTLPVYVNREARLFVYWDHEGRLPWQTETYRMAQRRTLRPNSYLRLHENRWTSSESSFLSPEIVDACTDLETRPLLPTRDRELYVGVDIAIKHDKAAAVGVVREGDRLALAVHRLWSPSPDCPLDLEETIEGFLRELAQHYTIRVIYADPWQMQRTIQTLQKAGLPIREFAQSVPNQTRAGQLLFDLFMGRNLRLYPNPEIRAHLLNCIAIESARGWRLAKERASRKIDAAVALSMACTAAMDYHLPPLQLLGGDVQPRSVDELQREADAEHERRTAEGAAWLKEQIEVNGGVYFPGID